MNEPSVDVLSITLTVSAFVEMDTPTTRLKMMIDDLATHAGVTSWSSFGHRSCDLQPEHIQPSNLAVRVL